MKEAWDLLKGVTPFVVAANPRALAERVLTSATVMLSASCTALFQREQDQIVLFASRGIRQTGMDLVGHVWKERRSALLAGEPVVCTAAARDSMAAAFRAVLAETEALSVTPISPSDGVLGLLYVEGPKTLAGPRQAVVAQLAGIAAVALRAPSLPSAAGPVSTPASGVDAYLARTPPAEVAREQLLVLLDRHEWNLSRVARALGVSRRTMYLRLERYGIERRHVPKGIRKGVVA